MAVLRMPHVDADAVRDTLRDLSRDLDMSRLDVHKLDRVRDELARLDLPSAGDLRREFDRLEIDLPDVGRLLRREPKRSPLPIPWLQQPSTGIVLGALVLLSSAVIGGVLAWLYQPDRGVARRKALRRRLHKLQRTIQHRV